MFFKIFQTKATVLAVGLMVVSLNNAQTLGASTAEKENELIAKGDAAQFITPAQAFVQDSTITPIPAGNDPIPFRVINNKKNIKIEHDKSIFKIEHTGLYTITADVDLYLVDNNTPLGQTPILGIFINGQSYPNFQSLPRESVSPHGQNTVTLSATADVYLNKDDKIYVGFANPTMNTGFSLGERTLSISIFNNSHR